MSSPTEFHPSGAPLTAARSGHLSVVPVPVAAVADLGPASDPVLVTAVHPGLTSASRRPTAVVYCEGNFGGLDGKTANGLVRHSERYEILSVIDSDPGGTRRRRRARRRSQRHPRVP